MAQEIELKFIVDDAGVETLRNHLHTLNAEHTPPGQLLNIYYETADNWLRRHDMGLRIRGDNGRYEMTLKIAGRTVGGLHQRPEYNIAIDTPELALDKLPAEVCPNGEMPEGLAAQVNPLFSTDFYREKWVVMQGGSRIEIALDQGEVKAGEHQEAICELELELLSGETADVLALAKQLAETGLLRQGSLSKAARGYHLAQGNLERPIQPLAILTLPPKSTVGQAMEAALENALAHWQYHEELWLRGNKKAKIEVVNALGLVRHILTLFGGIVPRKASASLRDGLTQVDALMASNASAQDVVFSRETALTKLAYTEWLVTRGWQAFLDAKAEAKLADSFKRFADIHLSRQAAELRTTFAYPLGDAYGDQLPRLTRGINTVQLLAGYYPLEQAANWLANWQGLRHAIETRQHIEIEHFRNEALSVEPFWLHSGKR
ncbi:TPA: inorganic triphosphatase [Kluyvera ascorbata]|uniref:Inorganic triphosphatase n=1 Tax=Kluyvera genomosp. 2 TaxID=2774054 RepID=A0A2T2XXR5_9ENTR|nr:MULTISPECIES: inorganic triphosphatase [Enterobacteriaceae]HAT3920239.1 inorganic triphosphatase [Kluyvera ascorbata]PSR45094.1 inorganic triphosphatase [Kluyvera genomosp. 2]BBQ82168.1 adenylate cyclase [Klebsiella sp. WP3-W18-ESBL-02]BBR19211.1 adenylate cyclase [Klebsiella sp. WP3-S18-ESBL-05]HAT3945148.1 inorganic triphosphatase [Kluyvera ascorbata]